MSECYAFRLIKGARGTGQLGTQNLISIKIETRDLSGRQGRLTIIKEFSKQMMHEPADLHIQLLDGLQ